MSETIDLRNVERAHSPNDALACPPSLCRAEADFESPIFRDNQDRANQSGEEGDNSRASD